MTTPTPETPAELAAEVKRLRRMVDDLQCRVRDTSNRATVTAIHAAIDRLATLAASSTAPAGECFNNGTVCARCGHAEVIASPAAAERKPLTVPFPSTPAELIEFVGSNFITHKFGTEDGEPLDLEDQSFYLSVHDLLSSFNQWADCHGITSAPAGSEGE